MGFLTISLKTSNISLSENELIIEELCLSPFPVGFLIFPILLYFAAQLLEQNFLFLISDNFTS